jgi:Flp pilus assembly secretin CpaC
VRHQFLTISIIAVLLGMRPSVAAQQPVAGAKPETAKPAAPAKSVSTPTKVQVTVSRFQGEKKISSLPYSLSVTMGGPVVRFRSGAQVPYATTTVNDGTKTPSYAYRDVGIAIDVMRATIVEPGLYTMEITVNDSSLSSSSQIQGAPTISGVPIFRNFSTNGTVLLKDGQTTQLTTAADPITGETMRVDVTLTVAK